MANEFNMHGGYFSPPGYLKVETGGSHDENPNGGVQIGIDQNGIPNMLEEGEPVYDDYVYSDNITADKTILKQFNIPEKYAGKLYSEIADVFVDEAEDRPLDSISNNGLRAMLGRLANAQEQQKQNQQQKELEDELANMSPEELSELEAMLTEQEQGQMPVEQEQIVAPEMMQQPVMANGGLIRRFDDGTPGNVTISGGAGHSGGGTGGGTRPYEYPSILERVLGSDNKIVRASNRFQDWLHDSTTGRIVNAIIPDSAMGAFVPAIKPAAGVSKIMDEAYRALEAEKAFEGAYRGAEVAGEVAKNSGVGKKVWNVAKYFVDPSAVWRSGWKPQGFWGKAAKGVVGGLQSGVVGNAEIGAIGSAIDKGVNISKSSKTEEFEVDPFSGRKYALGGNLFWPGGPMREPNIFGSTESFNDTWNRIFGGAPQFALYNGSVNRGANQNIQGVKRTGPIGFVQPDDTLLKGNSLVNTDRYKKLPFNQGYIKDGSYVEQYKIRAPWEKEEDAKTNELTSVDTLPTVSRYAGALGHGLLGMYNAFTPPTRFSIRRAVPHYPTGQINLQDMTYNPLDYSLTENAILANSSGTVRALRNSGLGPSTPAAIIATDRNIGQNLGTGFIQGWDANNRRLNDVIASRNNNASQRASFNFQVDVARAKAIEDAQRLNTYNELTRQRLNDEAETQQFAALSNELGYSLDALSKMGDENLSYNMVNSSGLDYEIGRDGRVRFKKNKASKGGTMLKKYKK